MFHLKGGLGSHKKMQESLHVGFETLESSEKEKIIFGVRFRDEIDGLKKACESIGVETGDLPANEFMKS